jgi:Lactonase, 7-bladed beta-propeller
VRGNFLFVSQMHSDKVEVFAIAQNPSAPSGILAARGFEFTGGITPQGITVSPDGQTVFVANMQTEDVSFLHVDASGNLTRQGFVTVGVTDATPDPSGGGGGGGPGPGAILNQSDGGGGGGGGTGRHLFDTDEEVGLRWFFTQSYSDDGQKSCGHCHWQSLAAVAVRPRRADPLRHVDPVALGRPAVWRRSRQSTGADVPRARHVAGVVGSARTRLARRRRCCTLRP